MDEPAFAFRITAVYKTAGYDSHDELERADTGDKEAIARIGTASGALFRRLELAIMTEPGRSLRLVTIAAFIARVLDVEKASTIQLFSEVEQARELSKRMESEAAPGGVTLPHVTFVAKEPS